MANAQVDTGHGATATFSVGAHSYNITGIDLGEETLGKVSTDHLLVTGNKTYMPEDLAEPGEVVMPYQFDNEAAQLAKGVVETLTITLPMGSGQTTAATWVGSGFITNIKRPNLQTNVIQDGQITFAFDGTTGPTFTAGS